MSISRIRFVTACQQLLALGVVLAVLTPATSVISLDVVQDRQAQVGIVPEDEAPERVIDSAGDGGFAAPWLRRVYATIAVLGDANRDGGPEDR